ncbi:MAG: alpha/beta fold hydrolase, partial [Planctomycetota bacterium]
MREEPVAFPARGAEGVVLDGRLLDGGGEPLVVSHPHPLHGGTMDHPVVVAAWSAAANAGFRALRYDFRGVGGSTGKLHPLSPLPLADLAGAVDVLGGGPLLAAGYSYGARVTLHALRDGLPISRAVLIGLPTRLPANSAAMSNLI